MSTNQLQIQTYHKSQAVGSWGRDILQIWQCDRPCRSSLHQSLHQACALLPPAVTMSLDGEKLKMAPSWGLPVVTSVFAYAYNRSVHTSVWSHIIVWKSVANAIDIRSMNEASVVLRSDVSQPCLR